MEVSSLPVWEEWIEIAYFIRLPSFRRSLPVWEEWIEISFSPVCIMLLTVSSRMGRVD